ncbi:MAG: hypothetical protein ABMA15_13130 [Vicinamibacterales bacterium]
MKRLLTIVVAACLLATATISAHDVVVEEIVQIAMRVADGRLGVQMRVPVMVLADMTLPRLPDGTLDTATIAEPLRIVAADAVRNLDVQQDGTSLPQTNFAPRLSADRTAVEIDVTYPLAGAAGISARLNTFQNKPLHPVRTRVEYAPATGALQTLSVMGQPSRVGFDPDAGPTVAEFARQAVQSIVGFGDHLLLLTCLLLPIRSARQGVRLVGLMLIGQALGVLAYVSAPEALAPLAPTAEFIAASALVVAALQVVVGARTSFVATVAAAFGLLFGIGAGYGLVANLQLAGSHHALAIASTLVTMLVAQVWLGAIMWAARSWLGGRGVPAYAFELFFAIIVGHTAVHRVMTTSESVAEQGSFLADHSIQLLALAWAVAMLVVAVASGWRYGVPPQGPARFSEQPSS